KLDVVTANAGSNTVSVLLGNGNGTFQNAVSFAANRGPTSVALGDFNRDGLVDLVVTNYGTADYYNDTFVLSMVSVLLGNGDGTFQAAGTIAVGSAPWKIVVGDFDGDHNPDLAVTSHWSDIISIVRGNGDGTFQPHVWYRTDRGPTAIAVADYNGDGIADLAVADYFSTNVSVLLGNSNGTLQPSKEFAVDLAPMGIAAADFNGD